MFHLLDFKHSCFAAALRSGIGGAAAKTRLMLSAWHSPAAHQAAKPRRDLLKNVKTDFVPKRPTPQVNSGRLNFWNSH